MHTPSNARFFSYLSAGKCRVHVDAVRAGRWPTNHPAASGRACDNRCGEIESELKREREQRGELGSERVHNGGELCARVCIRLHGAICLEVDSTGRIGWSTSVQVAPVRLDSMLSYALCYAGKWRD